MLLTSSIMVAIKLLLGSKFYISAIGCPAIFRHFAMPVISYATREIAPL
jgi:hypothetical protein